MACYIADDKFVMQAAGLRSKFMSLQESVVKAAVDALLLRRLATEKSKAEVTRSLLIISQRHLNTTGKLRVHMYIHL